MMDRIRDDITRVGWSGMAIFPTEDSPGLTWNYTIGLTAHDHPEMMVQGLEPRVGHHIIGNAADQVIKGGRYEPNQYYDEILEPPFKVGIVEVLSVMDKAFPFTSAIEVYGEIKGLQIVWPDENNRFPWHEDYQREKFGHRQILAGPWLGEE